jgi:hypothetical protein
VDNNVGMSRWKYDPLFLAFSAFAASHFALVGRVNGLAKVYEVVLIFGRMRTKIYGNDGQANVCCESYRTVFWPYV